MTLWKFYTTVVAYVSGRGSISHGTLLTWTLIFEAQSHGGTVSHTKQYHREKFVSHLRVRCHHTIAAWTLSQFSFIPFTWNGSKEYANSHQKNRSGYWVITEKREGAAFAPRRCSRVNSKTSTATHKTARMICANLSDNCMIRVRRKLVIQSGFPKNVTSTWTQNEDTSSIVGWSKLRIVNTCKYTVKLSTLNTTQYQVSHSVLLLNFISAGKSI